MSIKRFIKISKMFIKASNKDKKDLIKFFYKKIKGLEELGVVLA